MMKEYIKKHTGEILIYYKKNFYSKKRELNKDEIKNVLTMDTIAQIYDIKPIKKQLKKYKRRYE